MMAGVIALAVALAVATAAGVALRWNSGRFRPAVPADATALTVAETYTEAPAADPPAATATGSPARLAAPPIQLTEADLSAPLGEKATLVQFSTAFCAPCRPTRLILAQVADLVPGVRHVDIDATTRLDLVERLRIRSTPTILVLDQAGLITKRATGQPRKADVLAALGQAIDG